MKGLKKSKCSLLLLILMLYNPIFLYEVTAEKPELKSVLRINVINPGFDYEIPLSAKSVVSINPGIGYGGSYKDLNQSSGGGFTGLISPFLDVEWKYIYNREKRFFKNRSLENNAGNYLGLRTLYRGKELASQNMWRTEDKDFAVGPVWGLQRAYGPVHFLFNTGFIYYFDTKGNSGVFFPEIQLNIGWRIF